MNCMFDSFADNDDLYICTGLSVRSRGRSTCWTFGRLGLVGLVCATKSLQFGLAFSGLCFSFDVLYPALAARAWRFGLVPCTLSERSEAALRHEPGKHQSTKPRHLRRLSVWSLDVIRMVLTTSCMVVSALFLSYCNVGYTTIFSQCLAIHGLHKGRHAIDVQVVGACTITWYDQYWLILLVLGSMIFVLNPSFHLHRRDKLLNVH